MCESCSSSIFRCVLCGALLIQLSGTPVEADEEAARKSASGYNNERLEQEDRYVVPPEQAEQVWQYLVKTYIEDKARLLQLDPAFTSYAYDEDFTDTYFDTPSLDALEQGCGVRYRVRFNRTNPNDIKNGRQLLQIKSSATGNQLERGEVKFPIDPPGKIKTAEDAHPMLGLVKDEYRGPLKDYLSKLGMDAASMKPILSIQDFRRRLYIRRNDQPFMSISLDIAHSDKLWCRATVIEVEPELNEIVFTEADPQTRRYMESISAKIVSDLRYQFPAISRDLTPKYNRMFAQFEAGIPFLRLFHGMGQEAAEIVLVALVIIVAAGSWAIVRWRRSLQRRREGWDYGRSERVFETV